MTDPYPEREDYDGHAAYAEAVDRWERTERQARFNDALTAVNPRQALRGHEGESYPVQVRTWPAARKFGELTAEQKIAAIRRASAELEAELKTSASAIGAVLDGNDGE